MLTIVVAGRIDTTNSRKWILFRLPKQTPCDIITERVIRLTNRSCIIRVVAYITSRTSRQRSLAVAHRQYVGINFLSGAATDYVVRGRADTIQLSSRQARLFKWSSRRKSDQRSGALFHTSLRLVVFFWDGFSTQEDCESRRSKILLMFKKFFEFIFEFILSKNAYPGTEWTCFPHTENYRGYSGLA